MATLEPHSNGVLYSNSVINWYTLAVDGWERGDKRPGELRSRPVQPSPLLAILTVTTHPSTASAPTSYIIRCGNIIVYAV